MQTLDLAADRGEVALVRDSPTDDEEVIERAVPLGHDGYPNRFELGCQLRCERARAPQRERDADVRVCPTHMLASAEFVASRRGRSVRSIIVVPMRSRGGVIGAIVLRTERGGVPFSASDIQFCEVIAGLTARALRNAHRFEQVQRANDAEAERRRRVDLERIAFVAFLRRLVSRYTRSDDQKWAETLLPRESDDELERLVSVAMQVIEEEAKG